MLRVWQSAVEKATHVLLESHLIVRNLRPHAYRTTGRLFRSYYPWMCDQCGSIFNAAALRRGHTEEECREVQQSRIVVDYRLRALAENKFLLALSSACRGDV